MVKKLPLLKKQKRPSQSIYKHHNDDNAKLIKQKWKTTFREQLNVLHDIKSESVVSESILPSVVPLVVSGHGSNWVTVGWLGELCPLPWWLAGLDRDWSSEADLQQQQTCHESLFDETKLAALFNLVLLFLFKYLFELCNWLYLILFVIAYKLHFFSYIFSKLCLFNVA